MSSKDIHSAFEELLQGIEGVIEDLNQKGAKALAKGNYERTEHYLDQSKQLTSIKNKLSRISREINQLELGENLEPTTTRRVSEERLKKGKRTPLELFKVPLLMALEKLGGSGSPTEVEEVVLPFLEPVLTDVEYKPQESFHNKPKWTHRLAWTRYELVQEGLLKQDSPHGVWEISKAGEEWLKRQI